MTTKLIVIAGFLVAFAAGLVTGVQGNGVATPKPPPALPPGGLSVAPTTGPTTRARPAPPPSFFARELGLSQDQREKLAKIWDPVGRVASREMEDQRWKLRQDRDSKIIALVSDENRAKYEQILTDYNDQISKMEEQWRGEFDKAVKESSQVLTVDQRGKYEQILARIKDERPGDRQGRGPMNRGFGGRRGGRGPGQGPGGPPPDFQERSFGGPPAGSATQPARD
jgi:hypothetical protein